MSKGRGRRRFYGRPVKFAGWQNEPPHQHQFETITKPATGGKKIVIDKCQTCNYESARDLT